jgi:hypothetical protein
MLLIAEPYNENRCNRDADDYAIQQHMHVSSLPLTMGTYEEAKTMHVGNGTQVSIRKTTKDDFHSDEGESTIAKSTTTGNAVIQTPTRRRNG